MTHVLRLPSVCYVNHQVAATRPHMAGFKEKGKAWAEVAAVCSSLPEFVLFDGVKAEACKKCYNQVVQQHREHVKNGSWTSGLREGTDDSISRLAQECMSEEDDMTRIKQEKEEVDTAREKEREERAQQVSSRISVMESDT